MFGFRKFRLIGRHRRTVDPIAHPSNDPANKQLRYAIRCSQQDGPENHDGSARDYHNFPSKQLAVEEAEETSGRTPNVVNRGDDALHVRVRLVELLSEGIGVDADESTHDTLIWNRTVRSPFLILQHLSYCPLNLPYPSSKKPCRAAAATAQLSQRPLSPIVIDLKPILTVLPLLRRM